MMIRNVKILGLVACIVLLNGCAFKDIKNKRFEVFDNYIVENQLKSLGKVRAFQFRNWKSLDEKHLIISSSFKKQYLITINGFCQNLDFAHQIGMKQSMNNSLSAKFDSIVVKGDFDQECRIKTIHKIDKAQEDELVKLKRSYHKKSEAGEKQ